MKLTLISIMFQGHKAHRFVMALMVNGRAMVDRSVIAEMAEKLGARRGDTYTIG